MSGTGRHARSARWAGAFAATSAAAIWGGMYLVSKVVLDTIPPFTLLVVRFVVAAPLLIVAYRVSPGPRLDRRAIIRLAPVALAGFCVSLGAQFAGTRLSTVSNSALITSATPAFVLPFAAWLLREHPRRRMLVGLVLALAGVAVVIAPQLNAEELALGSLAGNLFLVLAALTWALYSVLVRMMSQRGLSALGITLAVTLWGIAFDVPLAAIELTGSPIGAITPLVIAGVLYLGVVSTAGAFFLWNKGFELLDANTAALCFFAQPVVGALLGAWLLDEPLGLSFFLGGALIIAGALVSQNS